MGLLQLLLENNLSPDFIFSIDIQPEYSNAIVFNLKEYIEYLYNMHSNGSTIIYFYNGEDTVGGSSEQDIQM